MADYNKDHGSVEGGHSFPVIDTTAPVEVGTTNAPEGECVAPLMPKANDGNARRLR